VAQGELGLPGARQAKHKTGSAKEVALQEARSAAARAHAALERVKERALPVRPAWRSQTASASSSALLSVSSSRWTGCCGSRKHSTYIKKAQGRLALASRLCCLCCQCNAACMPFLV